MAKFLTTGEVARRAGVAPDTVRNWDEQRKLRALRTETGRRLFREFDVQRFLERRAAQTDV